MFKLGPWEIALLVIVVLIIFGPKRLPELGRGIGHFFRNLKNSLSGEKTPEEKSEKKE